MSTRKARRPKDLEIDAREAATTYLSDLGSGRLIDMWIDKTLNAKDAMHLSRWLARAAAWAKEKAV